MQVTIITPYTKVTHQLADLSAAEKTMVWTLGVPKELRAEAFQPLAGKLRPFVRLTPDGACPKGGTLNTVKVSSVLMEIGFPDTERTIRMNLPDSTFFFKKYTLTGFCTKCRCHHSKTRFSVMVRRTYKGVPVQKAFNVEVSGNELDRE